MNEPTEDLSSTIITSFRHDIVKEALKTKFSNPKTKISDDALEIVCEISKALVLEAAYRSAKQASSENKTVVTVENVEAVLSQLMLDFF
ncbi:centromere protein X [Aethina tumida]|uniref:centromere protein X n=1 Tax=Aethina tumida TaxID=116153 RepID=UPI00096B0721|nr:centromere protein X [Aethina tumida]